MAAYGVDLGGRRFPEHFIVRDYVPQNALIKYTDVAITHAGMNSMSDLICNEVPYVSLPMGADQPLLAARAAELGATIILDINNLQATGLRLAVDKILLEPSYRQAIALIADSFRAAGGYSKAVDEIFSLVK